MKYYIKTVLLLIFFTGVCLPQVNNNKFQTKKLQKTLNNCKVDSTNCAYVEVNYIEMVSGRPKNVINKFINDIVIRYTAGYNDSLYSSVETAAESFLKDFSDFQSDDSTNTILPWFNEVSVVKEKSPDNIICLTFFQGIFTGGAHPNYYQITYNLSPEAGDIIHLQELFIPGFEKRLDKRLDKKFRKINNIAPGADLFNEGMFVSSIKHNENFAVLKEGIRFFYNQYEIAPYSGGTTEIILTYNEISDIIKEDGLLDQ